jgi:SGNH hydrolase-like domain, acetyltransferase AlgX
MGEDDMRDRALLVILFLIGWSSCRGGRVSWPRPANTVPAIHAEVSTLNAGYRRTSSQVLVRAVQRPTRAALDWAAYHANFMNAEPPPEGEESGGGKGDASRPFGGTVDLATLTSTVRGTPLSAAERAAPLAFAPMVEFLSSRKVAGGLEDLASAVRSESWGLGSGGALARQTVAEAFLHDPGGGRPPELWVKVEIQPWFHGLGQLPDEDGDGVPEVYGRARADLVPPEAVRVIRQDYAGKVLTPAEVKAWANQLASYWYPSYNTDLVPAPARWPDAGTEADIKKELGGASYPSPAVVMRGKPQGKPTYNVFLVAVPAVPGATTAPAGPTAAGPVLSLGGAPARARPQPVIDAVTRDLEAHGGSFAAWSNRLLPFHEAVRAHLRSTPAKVKGIAGAKGFLFFRNELEYVVGGDLGKQAPKKNPLPVVTEFKDALAARGVDFLFVPVPNKAEIYPDRLDPRSAALAGEVVAPFGRKLLLDLGAAGVEVVDLLPPFLAERGKDSGARETLYQAQDTHWGYRGLELAAHLVAARIKEYPWFGALARHARPFTTREVTFSRHGDLHSRLPAAARGRYRPETLLAHQVVSGTAPYDDDAESPIVVLGDSFTGVYELTECEHAGVSAQIAREIGYPVDLVMSWGGGPNVRQKLLRRGVEALARKRLVIWMMTARDLYHYWEDWEPLALSAAR